jgi:hypothetical protein
VFPELRLVTCGRAVRNAVENRYLMRITSHFLWIACGQRKNKKMMRLRACAIPRRGSRNAFTVRNGHCPGATPGRGRSRET